MHKDIDSCFHYAQNTFKGVKWGNWELSVVKPMLHAIYMEVSLAQLS